MSTRPGRVQYLLRVVRQLLVRADDILLADTEYLREELGALLTQLDELLEKMAHEAELLRVKEVIHGREMEAEEAAPGVHRQAADVD